LEEADRRAELELMRAGITPLLRGILAAGVLLASPAFFGGAEATPLKKHHAWRHIVIHHSATRKGNAAIMDRYHRNHRRMHNGLAYHFVINNGTCGTRDGEVEEGKRWSRQIAGGHVRQDWLNGSGIGICLVGNFKRHQPTRKQMESLAALVDRLRKAHRIPISCVKGHGEFGGERTECPGKYFSMEKFRRRLREHDARAARKKKAPKRGAAGARAGRAG
jgi:hypothetical protein